MNTSEKLEQVFSPLDAVTIEKEYEFLCPKTERPDIPDQVLDDAKTYLLCGEFPSRNPLLWYLFEGEDVDPNSERWKKSILNLFRLSCDCTITNLDNENNHVIIIVKFVILVINARALSNIAFKGVKCASVLTNYGTYPLILEKKQIDDVIE